MTQGDPLKTPFLSDDLLLFLACVREGSLTRAARALGTTVSTVSRRLDRLEEELERPLFIRNPDGLVATPAASALRDAAEAAERAALDLGAAARLADDAVVGTVTLATARDLAELVILPNLPELLARHPGLTVELEVGAPLVDLGRREADLALRIGTPGDDDRMIVRKLRETPLCVFVARALWPDPPPDPRTLPWIDFAAPDTPITHWGRRFTGRAPAIRVEDLGLMRVSAMAGLGMAALPDVYGHATPGLVEIARLSQVPAVPLFLVGHPASRGAPRVRVVWDFLVHWVGGDPAEDQDRMRPGLHRTWGWTYDGA